MVKKSKFSLGRFLGSRLFYLSCATAIVVILAILEITNTTHIFHKQKVPAVIPTTNTQQPSNNSSGSSNSSSGSASQPASNTSKNPPSGSSGTAPPGTVLLAPFGDFVSNHRPSSSTPNEVSVCNTTPGAACYIKFTNGAASTQLPTQTVGADGSTSWNWNIDKDAHLTSGDWQITAIATLNGQTKSTDDSIKLTIQ